MQLSCENNLLSRNGYQDIPETEYEPENPGRAAGDRGRAILAAWNELTDWEARHFADFVFREVRGNEPIPPLCGFLAEARDWADFASPAEIDAYVVAGFERMAPERQEAFLAYAQKGRTE
ncbi:MAG TPA: hypothetical protein VM422_12270 [Amaricoccus sp.]|nr:hypothetical protein [Amaricoccus sp.]